MTEVKMRSTVFYSWQSDSDSKVNRNFIEDALRKAIKQLKRNEDVLSAMRDDSSIEMDKDTQGVSGSPPIVDTILKKISQAAVFLPDLTIIGQSSAGRKLPNPNVLIEYGWALNALGHHRIVPVINTAAIKVKPEEMPFDIRHIRHPITYCLSETDDLEQRKKVKAELAKKLECALAAVFKHMPAEGEEVKTFVGQSETFSPSAFWAKDETFPYGTQHLSLPDAPRMFLRLIPRQPLTTIETSKLALDLIQAANLLPMSGDNIEWWDYERNSYGAFSRTNDEGAIRYLSQLFKTGEIWGVDAWTLPPDLKNDLAPDFGYFPCVLLENIFIKTLENYLKFAGEKLQLPLPLKLIAGVTDVREFRMGTPSGMRFNHTDLYGGNVIENNLVKELIIDSYDISSQSILMPFFEYVWEECGLNRPDKESLK